MVRPLNAISSSPSTPCTIITSAAAESLQHAARMYADESMEDAHDLLPGARRVGERPRILKSVLTPSSRLTAPRIYRAMMIRREHEADPGSRNGLATCWASG